MSCLFDDFGLKCLLRSIGRYSEAGLLEWMRFVIFQQRSRERSQRTSGPISEQALLHAVYNSGSWN